MPNLGQFIGKKFKSGGVGPDEYDCWGLARAVFQEYGIAVPDYRAHALSVDANDPVAVKQQCDLTIGKQWERIDAPIEPCLIVFRSNPNFPLNCTHCGVYVGSGFFMHILEKHGAYKERLNHPYWANKIEAFYRWPSKSS